MNVREYFQDKFPAHFFGLDEDLGQGDTYGSILAEMPLDSPCGDDCRSAIDAAAALVDVIKQAYGEYDYPEYINQVLNSTVNTAICFIRG